jgi:hypothetical protein
MRPSAKAVALACAATLLVGATAVASQGSSVPSRAASEDGPTAVTFKAGQRGDTADIVALWRLHVKPGLYMASMRATLLIQPSDPNATSAWGVCGVIDANTFQHPLTRIYFADSSSTLGNGAPAALSGSSVVRVTPDVKPGVICYVGDSTMQLYQPITVTFTPLGKRTYGTTTEVPIGGKQMGKRLKHVFGPR